MTAYKNFGGYFSEAILGNYRSALHFRQNLYIDSSSKFIFVKNHKAGCTTILASLYQSIAVKKNMKFSPSQLGNIHANDKYIPRARKMSEDQIFGRIYNPNYFNFTSVREPTSRLVSAYADKIANKRKSFYNMAEAFNLDCEKDISLQDFIQMLSDNPDILDFDRHWRPQYKEISYGLIPYNFICKLDCLDQELPIILKRLFPKQSDHEVFNSRKKLNHSTNSEALLKTLRKKDRSTIEKMFSADFELYEDIGQSARSIEAVALSG